MVEVEWRALQLHCRGAHAILGRCHGAVAMLVRVVAIAVAGVHVVDALVVGEDGGDGAATRSGSLQGNVWRAGVCHAVRMR